MPKNLGNEDLIFEQAGLSTEKFFSSLPKAKENYKNTLRPILVEGVTNVEIGLLVRELKNPVTYKYMNYFYVAGDYKNYPVVISRTEQGLSNAAAATAMGINYFNPVAVINQGTAGGYIPNLKVYYIVIGEKSIELSAYRTDFQAKGTGIDITKQEMRGTYAYDNKTKNFQLHKEYFADKKLLDVAKKVSDEHKEFKTVTGIIGTQDSWLSGLDHINFLYEKYGAFCEEMETNAAAQICQNAEIPFIGIRIISNNITNGMDFDPDTADNVQKFVLLVVEKYINDVLNK